MTDARRKTGDVLGQRTREYDVILASPSISPLPTTTKEKKDGNYLL